MYIISKFKSINLNNTNIDKYHIILDNNKILDLYHNDDLRFFKKKKQILNDITKQTSGIIIKISSWDYSYIKHDYIMSNKINHKNFIKHYCYFEYEEDILNYLSSNTLEEIYEHSSIIISPYHIPINKFDFNLLDKLNYYNCIKQIILALYHLYFNSKIQFKNIILDNLYIDYHVDKQKLKYKIQNDEYIIKTNYIIKFDNFIYSEIITNMTTLQYKYLYTNIENILKNIPNPKIYNLDNIIDSIDEFNNNSENLVNPLKILHIFLFNIT